MSSTDNAVVVTAAVVAVVALLVAAAAGLYAVVRTQRDGARIRDLQAQVRTLCGRRAVTHVTVTRTGRFTVRTARGC